MCWWRNPAKSGASCLLTNLQLEPCKRYGPWSMIKHQGTDGVGGCPTARIDGFNTSLSCGQAVQHKSRFEKRPRKKTDFLALGHRRQAQQGIYVVLIAARGGRDECVHASFKNRSHFYSFNAISTLLSVCLLYTSMWCMELRVQTMVRPCVLRSISANRSVKIGSRYRVGKAF